MMTLRVKLIAAGAGIAIILIAGAAFMFRAEIREGARLAADLQSVRGALESQRAESEFLRSEIERERKLTEKTRERVEEIERASESARNEMRSETYEGPYENCRDIRLDDAVVERLRGLATR